MSRLNDLQSIALNGQMYGAYKEPRFVIPGISEPVGLYELLVYVLANLGGGSGEDDVTEESGPPSNPPGAGEPVVYVNIDNGNIYTWDGSQWNQVSIGEDDITEAAGPPSVAPGAGEPWVYQNANNGALYIWDGTQWVLLGGSENEITEGSGPPAGAPGVGEPVIYLDEDTGNVWTWDGSQWTVLGVIASNGLTKTANDVELGGTLERATDVLTEDHILRFGRFTGDNQAQIRVRAAVPATDMFVRDNVADEESSISSIQSGTTIETNAPNLLGQVNVGQGVVTVITGDGTQTLNVVQLNQTKLEIRATELQVKTPDVTGGSATNGDVLTLINATTGESDFRPAGQGVFQYEAVAVNDPVDEGAFVTATGQSITYERTGGAAQNTEGILTVPAGVILRGLTVHFSSAQAPGTTFYLNVDYQNTGRPVNGTQDNVMPILATVATKPATFSDANPATNYIHSGTPLQIGIAQVDDNGIRTRVRYKFTNYSQQTGSNASMLSVVFP